MSLPVKKFGAGGVNVAIWENEGKDGNNYYTVSFERRYRDKEGNWKSTTSLKANDLPKAILALEKAYEFIALKEPLIQNGGKEEEFAATMA